MWEALLPVTVEYLKWNARHLLTNSRTFYINYDLSQATLVVIYYLQSSLYPSWPVPWATQSHPGVFRNLVWLTLECTTALWSKWGGHVIILFLVVFFSNTALILINMVNTIFYDLVHAFFFQNRTYSVKITVTFEPLVRFWIFKALNWSKFNFLLICGNCSLLFCFLPGKWQKKCV